MRKYEATKVEDLMIEKITKAMLFHSGEPFATTQTINRIFGKKHADVMEKIKSFESYDEMLRVGKIRPLILKYRSQDYEALELDADAFTFTCMSFTGKKAEEFKWAFIEAFKKATAEALTARVTARVNLANEKFFKLREEGKKSHKNCTNSVKALCGYAEESRGGSYGKLCPYFALITKLVYKTIGIEVKQGSTPVRDRLLPQQLEQVEIIENGFADLIFDLIEDAIPYKEIYQQLKNISTDIIAEVNHASEQETKSEY